MKTLIRSISVLAVLFGQLVQAEPLVTEYYTKVNKVKSRKDCRGEGNQIVDGQLIGSDCKAVKKYCPYGIGSRDNCITPCKDAAGGRHYRFGQTVKIKPRLCKWGPLKGQMISEVRIADVGSGVSGSQVDFFAGLCSDTNRASECTSYVSDSMVAEYNGHHGEETQMASEADANK